MVLSRDAVSLAGRVAVVTGGGAGIGRATAAAFVEFGAGAPAIWERDNEAATAAADEIGKWWRALRMGRDPEQVDAGTGAHCRKNRYTKCFS